MSSDGGPVDQALIAPRRSVRHELHRVREQRREPLNVACERVRRENAEAVQAHEVDSTGETIRREHSLRLAVG